MKKLFIKFITFFKKLFSIFLIFNLTCVSTAQAAAVFVDSFSVNAYNEGNLPDAVAFNNNGTKMFVTGSNGRAVNEYTLTTGFDVSTATYAGNDERFVISSEETWPSGLAFNNDGTKMFVAGTENDDIYEYTLTTGFDVSTASYAGDDERFDTSITNPSDVTFNRSGSRMFISSGSERKIYEFSLSTAFDISTASSTGNFSTSSPAATPQDVTFNDDGTKMFTVGWENDAVMEYTLSCAYKVTSSSTCDDPTTIKEVVASIEAQTVSVKRFAKQSSDSVLKRLSFIKSHKKDASLWSIIGNSQDFNVDFANTTLDQLVSLAPE